MASKDGERDGSDRSTYITQAATIFPGNQGRSGSMHQVLSDIGIGTFSRNQGQLGSMYQVLRDIGIGTFSRNQGRLGLWDAIFVQVLKNAL